MKIDNYISSLNKNGYVLIKNFFNSNLCKELKNKTKKLKPKVKIPYSNQPWGYGDVRKIKPFNKIYQNKKIHYLANSIINQNAKISHFFLVNKSAWIGPDVEWHQEVFNMDMYAPGLSKKHDWRKFLQVFISIDEHDKENGCLKVFEGSHREGVLKYEDILGSNLTHKRRVSFKELEKLKKKYKIKDIIMKPGDLLFFNHLLVHGSSKNISNKSRLSALIQFYDPKIKIDNKKFYKYINFRSNFVKSELEKKLGNLSFYKKNFKDFKKKS